MLVVHFHVTKFIFSGGVIHCMAGRYSRFGATGREDFGEIQPAREYDRLCGGAMSFPTNQEVRRLSNESGERFPMNSCFQLPSGSSPTNLKISLFRLEPVQMSASRPSALSIRFG